MEVFQTNNDHNLHLSFSQLRFIAESVPIHLNYLDKNERFIFVNKAASNFWKLKPEAMVGKTIRELTGPDGYAEVEIFIKKVLQGESCTHEVRFHNPDGEVRYFLNSYTPNFNSLREVIGFVATGMDISQERHIFEKAKKLAKEFEILADSMPQIVWTANPDGHVDYYNKRWYEFTGIPEGSLSNELWETVLHPEDLPLLHQTWNNALESGEPFELEFRAMHTLSGEYRWLLSRARSVKNQDGRVIKWYGSNTDIHDQKLVLQKLEIEQKLREQILSNLSHDLRTPLAAAKISAQMVIRKNADSDIQKLAHRIEDNMSRADRMIQDLLDASMLKAGHALHVNINHCNIVGIVKNVIEECSLSHGDRFLIAAPDEIVGEWDCDAIRRIIENIISNAIKYSNPASRIKINVSEHEGQAILSVTNFGIVIPKIELIDLFSPYKRMQSTQHIKGWGIGLSLVKGFTEAHHGKIEVTSDVSSGTTFTISLPRKHN